MSTDHRSRFHSYHCRIRPSAFPAPSHDQLSESLSLVPPHSSGSTIGRSEKPLVLTHFLPMTRCCQLQKSLDLQTSYFCHLCGLFLESSTVNIAKIQSYFGDILYLYTSLLSIVIPSCFKDAENKVKIQAIENLTLSY